MTEHNITSILEKRRLVRGSEQEVTRYRGRCSCGTMTFMHYATAKGAETALRRTHLSDVTGQLQGAET